MNDDLPSRALPADATECYAAVNRLARTLADRHRALFVDHLGSMPAFPGFHLPGSLRPSRAGHAAWGELLAERLVHGGVL
jgi:hypothetical protein